MLRVTCRRWEDNRIEGEVKVENQDKSSSQLFQKKCNKLFRTVASLISPEKI